MAQRLGILFAAEQGQEVQFLAEPSQAECVQTDASSYGRIDMTIGAFLLFLMVSCMVLSLDKVLHSRHRSRRLAMISPRTLPLTEENVIPIRAASRDVTKNMRNGLRWIDSREFEQVCSRGSEVLVFRLVDSAESVEAVTVERGEMAVTLEHIRDLLHWVPQQTRMVFYRSEAWSPRLVEQLLDVTYGRSILVLRGSRIKDAAS